MRSTRTSMSLARFTTGFGNSVRLWAPTITTWFPLRSMPRPLRVLAKPPPLHVLFLAEPSPSNASTVWFGGLPSNRDSNPTHWTRSSHWWTSGLPKIARLIEYSLVLAAAEFTRGARVKSQVLQVVIKDFDLGWWP